MFAIPRIRQVDANRLACRTDPEKLDLIARLSVVYESSMGGALRIQVRDGLGVAWLPQALSSRISLAAC